jgi:PIN domain nuclease of toxin-antitoxin system
VRLLLDTHVALRATLTSGDLKEQERSAIRDAAVVVVSVVTLWEIAIKFPLQRGSPNDMPVSGREALSIFRDAQYTILPVTAAHAAAIDDLPLLHGDPFDRMLVAQARAEGMTLLTRDARLRGYGGFVTVV